MILVDTSFFISLLDPNDLLHERAEKEWEALENKERGIPLSVIHETYNLLQKKKIKIALRIFRNLIYETTTIRLFNRPHAEEIEVTQDWFLKQTGSLSFTDISIVYCAHVIGAERVLSFDQKLMKYFERLKGRP